MSISAEEAQKFNLFHLSNRNAETHWIMKEIVPVITKKVCFHVSSLEVYIDYQY